MARSVVADDERAPPTAPVRRHRSTGTDPEDARTRVRAFCGLDVQPLDRSEDATVAIDGVALDQLRVGSLHWSGPAVAEPVPAGPLVVVHDRRDGRLSLERDGDGIDGSPLLVLPGRRARARWDGLDATVVALDPAAVARVGAELTAAEPAPLEFTAATAVSSERARFWHACAAHVRRDVLEHDALAAQPLVREHAVRHLALALLATFPNTTGAFESSAEVEDAAPATVRRAIAFIDAHAHEPIGLTEIAAAARLGPRGLQQAFAQHHDTSPLAHLRRVRLDCAHRDLQAGDPTRGDTVAAIAARWGFAHAGRFSLTYREHFGVSPTHTLRA